MATYFHDRQFTNRVHQQLALPGIYAPLGWQPHHIGEEALKQADMHQGIDYFFRTREGKIVSVQERFRESKYQRYQDCTLRFRRDKHSDPSRHASEFYKIKAGYLVYGIVNGCKDPASNQQPTQFLKFAVIDLTVFWKQWEQGKVVIGNQGAHFSSIRDGKLHVAVKENHDDSSSFLAMDVRQLHQLFGQEGIVLMQSGYF
jgi:hypothetical protein